MTQDNRSHDLENASPQWRAGSNDVDEGEPQNDDNKFPAQAYGGGVNKGEPDGVSSPSEADKGLDGRSGGGESVGAAYPNAHTGQKPTWGGQ